MTPHHTQIIEHLFYHDGNKMMFSEADVLPKIIADQSIFLAQRRLTLEKYNKYVQHHNDNLSKNNKAILEYNAKVIAFIEQNQLHEDARQDQYNLESQFSKSSTYAFNKAAETINNNTQKPLLQKKKLQRLTNSHEDTFSVLLWVYAHQIKSKSDILTKAKATTTRALQRLSVNTEFISRLKRKDGTKMLHFSKKTIQNHINRLLECGVFFNYSFHGHQKPTQMLITDEILVLYDKATKKQLSIENQLFKYGIEKKLPYNKPFTRTFINNLEIIEPVNKQSQLKGIDISVSYQKQQEQKNKSTQALHNQKNQNVRQTRREISPEISEFLHQKIEDPNVFCSSLANNQYHNYRFTDKRLLEKEVYHGNLTRVEFRELLLQYFFKMVGPLYRNKEVFYPSWRKAYNLIDENELINNNGSVPNKVNLLYKFENLIYRITYAKRYFNRHTEVNPLFPGQYFSPYRKTAKSGGFAYTIEALKYHQQIIEYKAKKQQREINVAKQNNKRYKAIELVEKKVRQLVNNKITINQLQDYVTNNAHIPYAIVQNLPKYIERAYKN